MTGGRIELVSLTKRFKENAVDSIDLVIASGEFFSLLGSSRWYAVRHGEDHEATGPDQTKPRNRLN